MHISLVIRFLVDTSRLVPLLEGAEVDKFWFLLGEGLKVRENAAVLKEGY